ncbi:MAG: thioredoxin family protein [Planctomycetota bacterium]|jgi:thioredoxin 1
MKENTKKYLIITGLFVAVFVLVTAKNLKTQKQVEGLADDSVIGQGKPVLLELGSHSCIPCKEMMPVLLELATTQDAFIVSFVDVWAVEGKKEQYKIQSIPTQIFFDADGSELFRHIGFYGKEDILNKWDELLNEAGPIQPDPDKLSDEKD